METIWKLQDAKARFSQLIENALAKGPQSITRRGSKVAVVLSAKQYEDMVSSKPSLKEFLLACPKVKGFEVERQKDMPRPLEL